MIRNRLFLVGSAVAAVLSAQSLAQAADVYYDSVGGDDGKDGTTEGTAKKTIKITAGNTTHIKRGSSYSGSLNLSNSTVVTYGCGPRVIVTGSMMVNNSTVEGMHVTAPSGTAINVQSGSTVSDCEADGSACTAAATGINVMGENNKLIGNYIHDYSVSQSGSTVNNSGGAEGIMVMGSNNEIAFNSVVNCQSVNTTLGGFEGGCYEIVNGKGAGQSINNISFHHNYCEKSVGLFEASSGNFSATAGGVLDNHGIVENVTVSYNVSVDSMWLFLLQSVNTDFKNVVFANNTIIHTPRSAEYWDSGGGHFTMALAYDSDTSTGTTIKADNQYYKQNGGWQPGTVAIRNNIFIDNISSTRNAMMMANLTDHSNNLFVPANASVSFSLSSGTPAFALDPSTESKVDLAAVALTADYQLTSASTPAIDKGTAVSMTSSTLAGTALNTGVFAGVFNQDIAKQSVPCGSTPDIGASEYCDGATLVWPGPSDSSSCPGTGGTASTGGASSTGGSSNANTGGKAATGGASTVATGGASNVTTGGASNVATGGASNVAAGGTVQTANTGGASDVVNAGGQVTASTGGDSTATGTGGANPGTPASTTTGLSNASAVDNGACSCRVPGSSRQGPGRLALGAIGLAALALARRRAARR